MFKNASVALLLDVLKIFTRVARRGVALTHVAESASEFGQALAIGTVADPVHGKVYRLDELRARNDGDLGLGEVHGRNGKGEFVTANGFPLSRE